MPNDSRLPGSPSTEIARLEHIVLPVEVDGFQVVHFSNYLRWFSGALMVLFNKVGLDAGRFDNGSVEIRVGRVQVAYLSSARLADKVDVVIMRTAFGESDMQVWVRAMIGNRILARGRLTVAFVESATGALTKVPAAVRVALAPAALAA